jgi:hypothetical protein
MSRAILVIVLVLAAIWPFACSAPGGDSKRPENQPPVDASTSLPGLTSLSVSPPSASLELAYGGAAVTQAFTAQGTFQDGSTRDVTNEIGWSVDSPLGSMQKGNFSTQNPGAYVVTAASGSITATATVNVKLTGVVVLPGAPAGAETSLAGTPDPSATPSVAYPLDGALFPVGLAIPEYQLTKGNAAQTIGRVDFSGDLIDLKVIGNCEPIPNGCALILTSAIESALAGASTGETMTSRVRLAAPDGSFLGESAPLEVRWSTTKLTGGIYYWQAVREGTPEQGTGIGRFDFDSPQSLPELYFDNDPDSPPLASGEQHPCVGCHAISHDGNKMGLTFGGSDPSAFGLLSIATQEFLALKNADTAGYATFTTFNADSTRLIHSFRGALYLRAADASLSDLTPNLFAETGEKLSHPFWAKDGMKFAFVGWQPNQNGASASLNGDLVVGGQIYVADSDGSAMTGAPNLVVPREANKTQYFPALSDDSQWLAFVTSRCDGPTNPGPYGNGACDGYDDATARLRLVSSTGGAAVELSRANGPENWVNSWPRFSPSHGTFRGKSLYWIAFSSRRPYGLRLPGSTDGTSKPQLWFTAVAVDGTGAPLAGDPSFAPVWLPNQNEDITKPTGNHIPQWTAKVVQIR